jgi:hypothetical protein
MVSCASPQRRLVIGIDENNTGMRRQEHEGFEVLYYELGLSEA